MENDRTTIEKILSGDLDAFKGIVQNYQRLVSHIVFKWIANPADREEICQDVFVKIYQNLSKFKFNSKLSTWIATIAYNTCLNYKDKKKVELYDDFKMDHDEGHSFSETLLSDTPTPDEAAIRGEWRDQLHEQIAALPQHYAMALALYHMDEMSYEEIGAIMKMPQGTVKSYIFRARQMLKENLLLKFQREELPL
jgi:RNA polymerase sigma factor (sigma-70 family)